MSRNVRNPVNFKKSTDAIRIAVIGSPNWLKVAAELFCRAGIACEIVDIRSKKEAIRWLLFGMWKRFDVIHHISGANWWWGTPLSLVRKPVVWHWIGSDVLKFSRSRDAHYNWRVVLTRRAAYRWPFAHLADSPELADELDNLGIKAEIVRLLPKSIEVEVEPLPKKFSVLGYWLNGRRSLYGGDIILQLAQEFSDIKFNIVGTTDEEPSASANVKFLGLQDDLSDIYSQSSLLIRIPKHDSLSAMVLEMLARGRYVIYNKKLQGCHFATNLSEARKALLEIKQKTEPNICGSQMIKEQFSLDIEAKKLVKFYERILRDT